MKLKRLLVPIDFSAGSLHALDYAVDLARAFRAEIVVVSVVEPIYTSVPVGMFGLTPRLNLLIEEQERDAREQMKKVAAKLSQRRIRHRAYVDAGSADIRIIKEAARLKADMIVMGTHGRSGLPHLWMGSVAEKVVRSSTCPVLTIRQSKAATARRRTAKGRK